MEGSIILDKLIKNYLNCLNCSNMSLLFCFKNVNFPKLRIAMNECKNLVLCEFSKKINIIVIICKLLLIYFKSLNYTNFRHDAIPLWNYIFVIFEVYQHNFFISINRTRVIISTKRWDRYRYILYILATVYCNETVSICSILVCNADAL